MYFRVRSFLMSLLVFLVLVFHQSYSFAISSADRDMGDHLPYGRFPGIKLIGASCDVNASPDFDLLPEREVTYGGFYPKRSCIGQGINKDDFKLIFEVDLGNPDGLIEEIFPFIDPIVLNSMKTSAPTIMSVAVGASAPFVIRSSSSVLSYGISVQAREENGKACAYVSPQFYTFTDPSNVPPSLNKLWRVESEFPRDFYSVHDIPVGVDPGVDPEATSSPPVPMIKLAVSRSRDSAGNLLTSRKFFEVNNPAVEADVSLFHGAQSNCITFPGQPTPEKTLNWGSMIAPSCTNYSLIETNLDISFTGVVVQCIEETIENIFIPDNEVRGDSKNLFMVFQNTIKNIIRALMALYIIFIGYQLIMGGSKAPKKEEWSWFWLKLVLVMYFALGSGMSDMFFRLTDISKHLSLIFMEAGLGTVNDPQLESLSDEVIIKKKSLKSIKDKSRDLEREVIALERLKAGLNQDLIDNTIEKAWLEKELADAQNNYSKSTNSSGNSTTPLQQRYLNAVNDYMSCYSRKKIESDIGDSSKFSANCSYPTGCSSAKGIENYYTAMQKCRSLLNDDSDPPPGAILNAYDEFIGGLVDSYNDANNIYNSSASAFDLRNNIIELEASSLDGDPLNKTSWSTQNHSGWKKSFGPGLEIQRKGLDINSDDLVIELASTNHSGMYRNIKVSPDEPALLTLEYAGRITTPSDVNDIEIWWDGKLINTLSTTSTEWKTNKITLPATGNSSARLEFKSAGSRGDIGGLLNNIDVNPSASENSSLESRIADAKNKCEANAKCKDKTLYPDLESLRQEMIDNGKEKESIADMIYVLGGAAVEKRPKDGNEVKCIDVVGIDDPVCDPSYEVGDYIDASFSESLRRQVNEFDSQSQELLKVVEDAKAELEKINEVIDDIQKRIENLTKDIDLKKNELEEFKQSDELKEAQDDLDLSINLVNQRKAEIALNGADIEPDSGYNYCDFRFNVYATGYEWMKLWDTLDCKIAKYLGMTVYDSDEAIMDLYQLASFRVDSATGASAEAVGGGNVGVPNVDTRPARSTQPDLVWFVAGSLFIPGPGALLFIMAISVLVFICLLTFRIMHIYIIAFMALAMLVYISPITITAALFKFTKSVFDKWLNQVISFTLQPVILFAYLAFMFAVIDSVYFAGNNKFDSYNEIVMENGECPDERSMACSLQKSTFYYKSNVISDFLGDDFRFLAVSLDQAEMTAGFFMMLVICVIAHILLGPVEKLSAKLTLGKSSSSATGGTFSNLPIGGPMAMARATGSTIYGATKLKSRAESLVRDTRAGKKLIKKFKEAKGSVKSKGLKGAAVSGLKGAGGNAVSAKNKVGNSFSNAKAKLNHALRPRTKEEIDNSSEKMRKEVPAKAKKLAASAIGSGANLLATLLLGFVTQTVKTTAKLATSDLYDYAEGNQKSGFSSAKSAVRSGISSGTSGMEKSRRERMEKKRKEKEDKQQNKKYEKLVDSYEKRVEQAAKKQISDEEKATAKKRKRDEN